VVVEENGGGSGGVMEKRRIVRGLVSAVRHVLCLCPVFFWATACQVTGHWGMDRTADIVRRNF